MKNWLNGLFVGLAIGFLVSMYYRSQQPKLPVKAANPRLDKDIDELQQWWYKLPTERKIDLELSRIEDESRLEDDEGVDFDED